MNLALSAEYTGLAILPKPKVATSKPRDIAASDIAFSKLGSRPIAASEAKTPPPDPAAPPSILPINIPPGIGVKKPSKAPTAAPPIPPGNSPFSLR